MTSPHDRLACILADLAPDQAAAIELCVAEIEQDARNREAYVRGEYDALVAVMKAVPRPLPLVPTCILRYEDHLPQMRQSVLPREGLAGLLRECRR